MKGIWWGGGDKSNAEKAVDEQAGKRERRYFRGRRAVFSRWRGWRWRGGWRSVWLNLWLTFRTGEIDEVPLRFTLCRECREKNRNVQCGEPGPGALSHRGVPNLINGVEVPSKTALAGEKAMPSSKNNQARTAAPLRTAARQAHGARGLKQSQSRLAPLTFITIPSTHCWSSYNGH